MNFLGLSYSRSQCTGVLIEREVRLPRLFRKPAIVKTQRRGDTSTVDNLSISAQRFIKSVVTETKIPELQKQPPGVDGRPHPALQL